MMQPLLMLSFCVACAVASLPPPPVLPSLSSNTYENPAARRIEARFRDLARPGGSRAYFRPPANVYRGPRAHPTPIVAPVSAVTNVKYSKPTQPYDRPPLGGPPPGYKRNGKHYELVPVHEHEMVEALELFLKSITCHLKTASIKYYKHDKEKHVGGDPSTVDTSPVRPPEVNESEEESIPLGRLLDILHKYNKLEKQEEAKAEASAVGYKSPPPPPRDGATSRDSDYERPASYGYRRNDDEYGSGSDNNHAPPTSGYPRPRQPNIYSEDSYSFNRPGYSGTSPSPRYNPNPTGYGSNYN